MEKVVGMMGSLMLSFALSETPLENQNVSEVAMQICC